MVEHGWVLAYLAEIEADFLRFYGMRPRETAAMPGPEFTRLASQLWRYEGAVQGKMRLQIEENEKVSQAVNIMPGTVAGNDALEDLFEFGTG